MRFQTNLSALVVLLSGCHAAPPANSIPVGVAPPHAPPANAVGGFSADLPPTVIPPGGELEPCFIFPLTVEGPSRFVGAASLSVGPGMHHGNLTSRPSTGSGIRGCPSDDGGGAGVDIATGGAVLFASSTQVSGSEWQHFPDGMAYRIKDGYEIVARMHYLNATGQPITVSPKYRWFTIDEASVKTEIGPFIWIYSGFAIPPNGDLTVTGNCEIPNPMHIVTLLPHIHRMGVEFSAGFLGGPEGGKNFLDSPGYDPDNGVMRQFQPAIEITQGGAGDGGRFSCSWHNTLNKTLVEGIGDNEMCMLFGYAWPPSNAVSALAQKDKCVVIGNGAPQ